eukprot:Hpha_TRINITY_DN16418_c0_g1::TRINITY_DN16418_c0_g1_i1::g.163253::m.163253
MGLVCPGGLSEPETAKPRPKVARRYQQSSRRGSGGSTGSGQASKVRRLANIARYPAFHGDLHKIVAELNARAERGTESEATEHFGSAMVPKVDLEDFVTHFVKYSVCSPTVWRLALLLLRRLEARTSVRVTHNNVQRLFVVASMIAARLMDDSVLSVSVNAEIAATTQSDLLKTELEVLQLLDWDVSVPRTEYEATFHVPFTSTVTDKAAA